MTFQVLDAGLYSLLVDFGRPRKRSLGVPVGGAADRWSLAIGNALVGNAADALALEISLSGPTLRADGELACVLYGAPFHLASESRELATGTTFMLQEGEELRVGGTETGMRAYLCVRGGFDAAVVLGSRSALEPIRAGDALHCNAGAIMHRFLLQDFRWNQEPRVLRVVRGLQADWYPEAEFHGQDYVVSPASNRMGLRLRGKPLPTPKQELLSEPVCPGSVQVTHDGQCIILGMDGQTIGGYPKIAQVISADLDKVGQLRAGDHLEFRQVSLDEAESVYQQKQAELVEWLTRLRVTLAE